MAAGLHDYGEELMMRDFFAEDVTKPNTIDIGLYNDAASPVSESDDLDALSGEPTGSAYARQTLTIGSADMTIAENADANWQVNFEDVSFDVSDSTVTVDSYFVVVNYESTTAGDTEATDHLFSTASLESDADLSGLSTLTVDPAGAWLS